jgi:hypothetical protein
VFLPWEIYNWQLPKKTLPTFEGNSVVFEIFGIRFLALGEELEGNYTHTWHQRTAAPGSGPL